MKWIKKKSKTTNSAPIVAGSGGKSAIKTLSPRKKLLVIFVFTLLLLSGAGYMIYERSNNVVVEGPTGVELDAVYRKKLLDEGQKAEFTDYLILGNVDREKKEYVSAESYYKKAEELEPEDFDVLYALASIYRLQKNKEDAIAYYEKVITIAKDPANPYHVNLSAYEAEHSAVESGNFESPVKENTDAIPL